MMDGQQECVMHVRVVSGSGGGPEKTILNCPRFLIPHGYPVVCAYLHPPGDPGFAAIRQRAEILEAPLAEVEDRGPWDLRVPKRLLALCRQHRVSIWHGHDYKSNALGLLLRRFWPMRLVTTVHGWVSLSRKTNLYHWVDRLCLRHYDRVICVSDDLYRQCIEAGVPPRRCQVIENAIDTQQYSRGSAIPEAKRRLGIDPHRLLVGGVGRLSEEKDFPALIRAVDQLLQERLEVDLVIIGEGNQRAELEGLIRRLGRQSQIRLLGYRSDTLDWYQAMDVFALSSLREGLPNVLLEAMALEVPVVATRVAGVPRLVQHEHHGLLIEPGAVEQLAAGIKRLLLDEGLRQRLSAAGRRRILDCYSFDARMAKIRQVYQEVRSEHAVATS